MNIKYCYKEEIHKSFTVPQTFNALLKDVRSIFEDALPTNFSVQYKDSEDDLVTISSDLEYRSMLRFDVPKTQGSIKLYITPSQKTSTDRIESKVIFVSNENSEGSFEIINNSKSGTEGGISEFTLTSDEEKNNRSERSHSSDSRRSRKSEQSLEGESTSSPKNDSSNNQDNETLDNLYEMRALLLKECLAKSPKVVPQGAEASAQKDEADNSLEKLLNIIEPCDYKNPIQKSPSTQIPSLTENLRCARAHEEFAARTIQRVFRRIKDLKYEGANEFNIRTVQRAFKRLQTFKDCYSDLYVSREREQNDDDHTQMMEIINAAAVFIQKNYRGYRVRKLLKMYFSLIAKSDEEMQYQGEAAESEQEERTDYMGVYDRAAQTIQKMFRGFIARKRLNTFVSYEQESFGWKEPEQDSFSKAAVQVQKAFRGYRLRKLLERSSSFSVRFTQNYINFEERSVEQDEEREEQEDKTEEHDEVTDSWRWAQEQVQVQNGNFDAFQNWENNWNNNNEQYPYEYTNLKSYNSYTSFLDWNTDNKKTEEVHEVAWQSPRKDDSYRYSACHDYEYQKQPENAYIPRHPLLNLRTNYFDLQRHSNASPTSLDSPYIKETNKAHDIFPDFERQVQDYRYRLMQGISSSLLFCGPNNGKVIVYKTIYIENTGVKQWTKCYVRSIGTISGKTAEIHNVEVGQIVLVTLELSGYFDYGYYNTHWKLVHENENGMVEAIGEPFNVEFTLEPKQNTADCLSLREVDQSPQKESSFMTERDNEDEREQEEERREQEGMRFGRKYEEDEGMFYEGRSFMEEENIQDFERYINYKTEAAKVGEIRTMFPFDSLDEILAFVNQRPDLTTEEVVLAYLAMRSEC